MAKKVELSREGKKLLTVAKKGLRARRDKRKKTRNDSPRQRVSTEEKRRLMKKTNWKCHFCGRRIIKMSNCDIDHIRQRVQGGRDIVGNYLAACKRCNSLRGRLHYSEIQEALAFGAWALSEIRKETTKGIRLANIYGPEWVKRNSK